MECLEHSFVVTIFVVHLLKLNDMKYTINDEMMYVTAKFHVSDENGIDYLVTYAENDWYDDWEVRIEDTDELISDNDINESIIEVCTEMLSKYVKQD
jgi:hypothetical protein